MSSSTILDNFRSELTARFVDSEVFRDVHAIGIRFSDSLVDVVPAFYSKPATDGWPLYAIPDGSGGWLETSPERHNKFIRDADQASGGQLKKIARLMKFWRQCRKPSIPISSFHVEMVLSAEKICVGVRSHARCFSDLLSTLTNRQCAAFQDPLRISGLIPATKTTKQRELVAASISNSSSHAQRAVISEGVSPAEAHRQWDIVFNGRFPG